MRKRKILIFVLILDILVYLFIKFRTSIFDFGDKLINPYTVSINLNGGTYSEKGFDQVGLAQGKKVNVGFCSFTTSKFETWEELLPTEDQLFRMNSTFVGWKYDPVDELTVEYNSRVIVVNAVWSYNVNFKGNGGTTKDGESVKKIAVQTDTLSYTQPVFTREGYTFKGWDKDLKAINALSVGATFNAQWEYTVTFDLAGGNIDGKTSKITVTSDEGKSVSAPGTPVKEGYTFDTWDINPSSVNQNATITALWLPDPYYYIRLDQKNSTDFELNSRNNYSYKKSLSYDKDSIKLSDYLTYKVSSKEDVPFAIYNNDVLVANKLESSIPLTRGVNDIKVVRTTQAGYKATYHYIFTRDMYYSINYETSTQYTFNNEIVKVETDNTSLKKYSTILDSLLATIPQHNNDFTKKYKVEISNNDGILYSIYKGIIRDKDNNAVTTTENTVNSDINIKIEEIDVVNYTVTLNNGSVFFEGDDLKFNGSSLTKSYNEFQTVDTVVNDIEALYAADKYNKKYVNVALSNLVTVNGEISLDSKGAITCDIEAVIGATKKNVYTISIENSLGVDTSSIDLTYYGEQTIALNSISNKVSKAFTNTSYHYFYDFYQDSDKITTSMSLKQGSTYKVVVGHKEIHTVTLYDGANVYKKINFYEGSGVVNLEPLNNKGINFIGWYKEPEFTNKVTSVEDNESSLSLYAKYEYIEYNVSYLNVEGLDNSTNKTSFTFENNYSLAAVSKSNYKFDGWYLESTFKTKVNELSKNIVNDDKNTEINLYAKFTPSTFNVVYNGVEKYPSVSFDSSNFESVLRESIKYTPSKLGYYFSNWEADYQGVHYTSITSLISTIDSQFFSGIQVEDISLVEKFVKLQDASLLGLYPNKVVTDETIINEVKKLANGAYDTYVQYNGSYYCLAKANISFDELIFNYVEPDVDILCEKGKEYVFLCLPVEFTEVLTTNTHSDKGIQVTRTLISNKIIDAARYDRILNGSDDVDSNVTYLNYGTTIEGTNISYTQSLVSAEMINTYKSVVGITSTVTDYAIASGANYVFGSFVGDYWLSDYEDNMGLIVYTSGSELRQISYSAGIRISLTITYTISEAK